MAGGATGAEVIRPPRFLILGGGAVVSEFYLPALQALGYIDETLILDVSAATTQLQHRYPKLAVEQADFRSFLDRSSIINEFDAAVVALPNSYHEDACGRALNGGLHVLCEKPLALTRAASLRLVEQAETVNRILAVGMVRRLLPSVSALREALSQNLIGELINVDIEDGEPYAWPSDSGAPFRPENGGVLADMGIHYIDLIEDLVGKLAPITYQDDSSGGVEANAEFQLKTESGIPIRLALSRTSRLRNTMMFRGRLGELILEKSVFDSCRWRSYQSELTAQIWPTKPFYDCQWPLTFESCFAEQFLNFAKTIQGGEAHYVSGREAVSSISLIEWAYQHRAPKQGRRALVSQQGERPTLHKAPVLVTGGTGFIGVNLVERLNELGCDRITVPLRSYRTCAPVARFPVDMRRVNLLEYEEVKAAITGARYVFHLAYGREGAQAARVTVEGTRNVVEAAIAAEAESVVVLSSMAVFGQPQAKEPVDETWPYAPAYGEYGQSKARMEQWCLKRARSSEHTRIVVLNPTCVYGPLGKTYTEMPVKMTKEGAFGWIEEGQGIANYTYVDNLVDAILLAASCQDAHGQRFIVSDGATTWRAFLSPLLGLSAEQLRSYSKDQLLALHRNLRPGLSEVARIVANDPKVRATLKNIPSTRFLMQMAEQLMPAMLHGVRDWSPPPSANSSPQGSNQVLPPLWLCDLFGPSLAVFSSKKAQRILGWQPEIKLETGQEISIAWLRDNHLF